MSTRDKKKTKKTTTPTRNENDKRPLQNSYQNYLGQYVPFHTKKHEILKHSSSLFILSSRIPVMFLDDDPRTFRWQQQKREIICTILLWFYGIVVLFILVFSSLAHSISYLFVCLLHCVVFHSSIDHIGAFLYVCI